MQLKRERRLFYACSLTALAVHVLARTTGLFNNNAVAYKPTIMIFMDMIQTHDSTWQPGNHVATQLPQLPLVTKDDGQRGWGYQVTRLPVDIGRT